MTTEALYRRILRRETHPSRATPAITLAVVAIVALAWLTTEIVLAAIGAAPLLLSPDSMVADIAALPSVAAAWLVAAGVVLALIGLVALVVALKPGRLGRHDIADERAVVVVHDEVIGSALVRVAADTAATDPDAAVATVGARSARVRITPATGIALDRAEVAEAVQQRLASFGVRPALSSRVVVAGSGRVGS